MDPNVPDGPEANNADNVVPLESIKPRYALDAANQFLQSLWADIDEDRVRGREMGRAAARECAAEMAKLSPSSAEPKELPALIDAPEAARLYGITEEALWKRKERWQLPRGSVVQTGRRVQFHRAMLLAGIERKASRR